jgi:hypothetical protein
MYELNPSLVDGQLVIPVDLASAIVEFDRMLSAPMNVGTLVSRVGSTR